MLGFDLDIWDYLTFLVLTVAGLGVLVALIWLAGLPGRIALPRNHPDAEAVKLAISRCLSGPRPAAARA
jgi:hypothetical protein